MRNKIGSIVEGLAESKAQRVSEEVSGYEVNYLFRHAPKGLKFKLGQKVLIYLNAGILSAENKKIAMKNGFLEGEKLVLPKGTIGIFKGNGVFDFNGLELSGLDDQVFDFNLTIDDF